VPRLSSSRLDTQTYERVVAHGHKQNPIMAAPIFAASIDRSFDLRGTRTRVDPLVIVLAIPPSPDCIRTIEPSPSAPYN